jgi:hypothetical protein
MAVPGQTYDYLVRNVWQPELYATHFRNFWLFNDSRFPFKPALGGDTISQPYEYAVSTNVSTFQYDDPMVEPFSTSDIRAYFNKQSFQEAARLFLTKMHYRANGGYQIPVDEVRETLDGATKNLRDLVTTTILTSLESQIDAANTYSDAALTRATYGMTSYEEDTATALTITHLEDMVEALMQHTTYGLDVRSRDDLLWLMPENQKTNISRLATGGQYFEFNASSDSTANIDGGRQYRTASFDNIEIMTVPEMTSTTILLVHKPDIVVWQTEPFMIEEKTELAHTRLWKLTDGYNLEVKRPANHGKLSAKTA